jgi:ubiquinone/menaquinone biosynthesis C-methylase UbiE
MANPESEPVRLTFRSMTRHIIVGRAHTLIFIPLLITVAALAQGPRSIATQDILAAINVREGATVCEIGAGDGELTIAAARLVGSNGRVYTSELGDSRVASLQRHVKESGLAQITVVAGDAARTNFPEQACDAVFMRNVYHHFADPAAMNASIAAALKPGGRLAVVDFAPGGEEAARPADRDEDGKHGVTSRSVSRELTEAGFEPVSSEAGDRRWFMVVVARPKVSARAAPSGAQLPS